MSTYYQSYGHIVPKCGLILVIITLLIFVHEGDHIQYLGLTNVYHDYRLNDFYANGVIWTVLD